jgi:hypothetical protein
MRCFARAKNDARKTFRRCVARGAVRQGGAGLDQPVW